MSELYPKRRADGWPLCPKCGEDELWANTGTEADIWYCMACGPALAVGGLFGGLSGLLRRSSGMLETAKSESPWRNSTPEDILADLKKLFEAGVFRSEPPEFSRISEEAAKLLSRQEIRATPLQPETPPVRKGARNPGPGKKPTVPRWAKERKR